MKPSKLSVFELFEKERRYVLPVFQRPYVWKEEEQWAPLWDDIRETADRVYARNTSGGDEPRTHFLGAVVLSQLPTFGRQVNASDVVDGQQRLTTLQVLLAALRDAAQPFGDAGLARDFQRLTVNTCRMEEDHEAFKVWPTTTDRGPFERVLTAESADEVRHRFPAVRRKYQRQDDPRHQIAEAYLFFSARIADYLGGAGEEDDVDATGRLDALLDAITKYMELVVIELEGDDDPQVIFESLNGRGAPLLPSDLVRNFVFLEASRLPKNDVEVLYESSWARYDVGDAGAFWKEEVSQGRLNRPRIDLFLFHYVTARTARDTRITHLYQEFRRWWGTGGRDVEAELARLGVYADAFTRLVAPPRESTSRYDTFARRLGALDTSTVYPVLLHLAVEAGFSEADLDRVAVTLESFLVRRMVCGVTPKNYNRLFLGLLQHLRQTEAPTPATVEAYLLKGEGDSVRWPGDKDFEKAWFSLAAYKKLRRDRTRMVLEALDRALLTDRQEKLPLPDALTIEHILPQNAELEDWPLPLELMDGSLDMDITTDALKQMREHVLHTFGNLTLLTQSLNSSVSNGPFLRKRPAIAAQSQLPLNAYFQRFDDSSRWALPEIVARGQALFAVATDVWPRPESEGA